jgi:PAS domain S-box-containing protein
MPTKLKVLILEDRAEDAELALYELRRAGYEPEWRRVETEPDFLAQLDQGWDIILVDYNLPEFDGLRALEIMRERALAIPRIIVSGTIGEDKAVAAMKAGANDYVMKDRLAHLGPAVERELRDAVERRERKRAEEALRASEERFRTLSDLLPQIVFETDSKGTLTFTNQFGLKSVGYSLEDFQSGINIFALVAPEDRETITKRVQEILSGSETASREFQLMRKDGGKFPILMQANAILEYGVPIGIRGIAIDITERIKAEAKLRDSLDGLRKALSGIIQVLSAVSEKRDPYTAGHQRRVADLAGDIGQEMGLTADRVEGLRMAGIIHDIGKVSIPAEILSKPASLTNLEFEMIKSHPKVGHDILHDIDFSWPIAQMILQHHERMNGSGYPQRLKGDDILLESRILAVSDVIEAMASHRPYRPALGIEAALREIEKNRGILYDPVVVSACLALFREKGYALKE